MDQSEIAAVDDLRIGRGRRSYKLRHALDSKDVGKAQHLFNAMELVRGRNAFLQSKVLQCAGEPWVVVSRYAGTIWSGGKGECCRAVTALRGHRDIVLPPEPREEPGALRECRSRRHGDDAIDVRVAVNDPRSIGEDKRVDFRFGPRAAQAADQRCCQKQIADATQRDDEDA